MQKVLIAFLFELSSINQVKRKLMDTATYGSKSKGRLVKGLSAFVKEGAVSTSKQLETVDVINDLTIILMAPRLFQSKLIVINDIERRIKKLGIDEILGLIDDYPQQHGARFILILNNDRMITHRQHKMLWDTLREKLIDQESQLSISATKVLRSLVRSSRPSIPSRLSPPALPLFADQYPHRQTDHQDDE